MLPSRAHTDFHNRDTYVGTTNSLYVSLVFGARSGSPRIIPHELSHELNYTQITSSPHDQAFATWDLGSNYNDDPLPYVYNKVKISCNKHDNDEMLHVYLLDMVDISHELSILC